MPLQSRRTKGDTFLHRSKGDFWACATGWLQCVWYTGNCLIWKRRSHFFLSMFVYLSTTLCICESMQIFRFNKTFTFLEKCQVTFRLSEFQLKMLKLRRWMATVVKIAHCWELLHIKFHVFYREIRLFTKEHERCCQNAQSKDEVRGILQSCVTPIKELVPSLKIERRS